VCREKLVVKIFHANNRKNDLTRLDSTRLESKNGLTRPSLDDESTKLNELNFSWPLVVAIKESLKLFRSKPIFSQTVDVFLLSSASSYEGLHITKSLFW
jgi:hypothetical protein